MAINSELALQNIRILVAEDDLDSQALIRMQLEHAGASVTLVANGEEAVQVCSANTFDIVFLDIDMPKLDGYSVAELLRSRGAKQPLIALSAHDLSGDILNAHVAGFNAHVAKPFDGEELVTTVRKFLKPSHK